MSQENESIFASESFNDQTFSPVVAKGALNHCSNVEQDLKMEGRRKLRRAQSSGSLF